MEYDKYGVPIGERSMEIIDDKSRKKKSSGRVKDSIWRDEEKPWGDPPYPGKASAHGSLEIHYL